MTYKYKKVPQKKNTMNEHINCTRCNKKFINDDEHISTNFGYTRWNTRFANCVDCRNYQKNRKDMTTYSKCEYCGSKIRTKGRFDHFKTDKCKKIRNQRTSEIIDKLPTLPDSVFGKIWDMIQ